MILGRSGNLSGQSLIHKNNHDFSISDSKVLVTHVLGESGSYKKTLLSNSPESRANINDWRLDLNDKAQCVFLTNELATLSKRFPLFDFHNPDQPAR